MEKEKAHRGRSGAIMDIYIGIISGYIGVSLLLSKLTTMWGLIDESSSNSSKVRFLNNLEGTSWGYIIGAFSTLYAIFRLSIIQSSEIQRWLVVHLQKINTPIFINQTAFLQHLTICMKSYPHNVIEQAKTQIHTLNVKYISSLHSIFDTLKPTHRFNA